MELRFLLVSHCNYDCYFCLNEYFGSKSTHYELLPSDYRKIANAAKSLSINRVTLTGGEPTLRKDLLEIISELKSEGIHITLITNGHILDQRLISLKLIDELHISFHAMTNDAWYKVTRNRDGMEKVRQNIIAARKINTNLRIKLNIVSLSENNTFDQMQRYISFAREYNLELNIFQEGYFKMLELLGIEKGETPKPSKWWDLADFKPELIEDRLRKKTYLVNGVKVSLSYTSTDRISWDSIWIDPLGGCYCDIKQDTPVLDLSVALPKNSDMVKSCLKSVLEEALCNQRQDEEGLSRVLEDRKKLPVTTSSPVGNLFKQ